MADVTLTYKGATIAELSESGNKTLETAGKYCEADILLEYVKTPSGIVLAPNILDGSDWAPGYFSQSGGITAQSAAHKEVYTTNYIEVIPGAPYFIALKCDGIPSNGAMWCGLAFYDENKAFISRVIPAYISGRSSYPTTVDYFAPTSATKYIRVSFRKYNKAFCYISNSGDFIDSLGEVLEVIS